MKMILKPLSENQIQVCSKCFQKYKEDKTTSYHYVIVFDILRDNGYIQPSKEDLNFFYNLASKRLSERNKLANKTRYTPSQLAITFLAKELTLEKFFKELIKSEKNINELLIINK